MVNLKQAGFYTTDGKYLGETPPAGSRVVKFDPGKHKLPNPNTVSGGDSLENLMPWLLAGGAGMLGHTVASTVLDDDGREKRKRSAWEKLLRTLIPIGVGGLGAYGGYLAGKKLGTSEKKAEDVIDLGASADAYDEFPWARALGAAGTGFGAYGAGKFGLNQAKKWLTSEKMVAPGPEVTGPAKIKADDFQRQIRDAESMNAAADRADAASEAKFKADQEKFDLTKRRMDADYADAKARYGQEQQKYKSEIAARSGNEAARKGLVADIDSRIVSLQKQLGTLGTDQAGIKAAKGIEAEIAKLEGMKGKITAGPVPPVAPKKPVYPNAPVKGAPAARFDASRLADLRTNLAAEQAKMWTKVPNAARPKALSRAKMGLGGAAGLGVLSYLLGRSALNHVNTGSDLEEAKSKEEIMRGLR